MNFSDRTSKTDVNREHDDIRQVNRDRLMRAKRKRFYQHDDDDAAERSCKIRLARGLIRDLENHGPAGLVHIVALSSITDRPIRIWSSKNQINRTIGQNNNGESIDVEYHRAMSNGIGHWTLRGNKDPRNIETNLNSCLFAVVASQINANPNDLRAKTIRKLKGNIRQVANRIDEILWYEKNDKIALMIGGACYNGVSAQNARIVLDNSQNNPCHACTQVGHPRGHASHPSATGPTDSVENYSMNGMKSGFLSRKDQDIVAHHALTHRRAQDAMHELNQGAISCSITISARDIENSSFHLPKMKEYYEGGPVTNELTIAALTLVLRHHAGRYKDKNADVFVHTLYPRRS